MYVRNKQQQKHEQTRMQHSPAVANMARRTHGPNCLYDTKTTAVVQWTKYSI